MSHERHHDSTPHPNHVSGNGSHTVPPRRVLIVEDNVLARRKLVVLVDEGNFVHNHVDELREYLKAPSSSSLLAALVPTDKVPALSGACLVECRSLKPADLQRWLSSEAQRLGKTLDRAAAELLASRAGGNLSALAGHLEKLATYAGSRPILTAEDVRGLVGSQFPFAPCRSEFLNGVRASALSGLGQRTHELLALRNIPF